MKIQHPPYHWLLVALALLAFLFIIGEAHGQATGAAAVFEGRPAMAGAQGGLGAQAGMPQGGLGVQGSDVAERGLRLRKPTGLDEIQQARRDNAPDAMAAADTDIALRKDMSPTHDQSLAKEHRSSVKKAKRAVKRTITRARHGVSEIDTTASAGTH